MQRENEFTLQSERMRLLQDTVESGYATLAGQLTAFTPEQLTTHDKPHNEQHQALGRTTEPFSAFTKRGKTSRYRLALPRWFTKCVWDFTVHESNHIWTFQLQPVNMRPAHTYAFDFVRNGDLMAVRKLLEQGHLSVNDQSMYCGQSEPLLKVSNSAIIGHFQYS